MNIFKYLIKNAKRDWDFGDICYLHGNEHPIKYPNEVKGEVCI